MAVRKIHRWFGIGAAGFGLVLAITGITLAVVPLKEAATTGALTAPSEIAVATLASAVVEQVPSASRIEKSANHSITVHYFDAEGAGRMLFDPATMSVEPLQPSAPIWITLKKLHRSFFLGDLGRALAGMTATAMVLLSFSGVLIMKRRMGGWRAVIAPPKTTGAQHLHMDAVRLALPGLLICGLTGVFLSLVTFSVLPDGQVTGPDFPDLETALPIALLDMPALQSVQLSELRELSLPDPEFPGDPIILSTHQGLGFIDPASGQMASFEPLSTGAKVYEFIYMLHTGQGAWMIGVLLGVSMLAVPFAIASGVWMALRRPNFHLDSATDTPSQIADTIILVGSEGNTTWGFATTLAKALSTRGDQVHLCAMDALEPEYSSAKRLIFLTATYGSGEAPATAADFFRKLDSFDMPGLPYVVLGFGDRQFDQFCQFAHDVDISLRGKGMSPLLPIGEIDRQDCLEFQQWGRALGRALQVNVVLDHQPKQPKTSMLRVIQTQLLGEDVQAPVAILRFKTPRFIGRLQYEAGDLLGVLAPGENRPRFYSLASSNADGMLEICVRRQPGGACSNFLTNLKNGDTVSAFIKTNPTFRPSNTTVPLVLVGAGAGIGPLMGFLRGKSETRPAHLFWGGRHPSSDFLYQSELNAQINCGNLTTCETAFSRIAEAEYVQDRLLEKADELRQLINNGAEILICGGNNMGRDVAACFQSILAPLGLSVEALKSQKRYLEDVY